MRILIPLILLALAITAFAQEAPKAHFHHIHLNATDPAAAIDFYTRKFDCEKRKFGEADAVWTQKSWMLFTKVKDMPPSEIVSAIWHFGWGAEDMPAAYKKQIDSGTKFQTPITDISDLVGKPFGSFFYAYVDGPGHALIELNTAAHHRFGHVHLLSEDPIAAGQWYKKYFGIPGYIGPRTGRIYRGVHVDPVASLNMDNVNIVIYPVEYARDAMPELWKDRKGFEPTKGRVVDHLAFSVDSVHDTLERLRKDGVKATDGSFIEGPDRIRIEIVESQAVKE
ncbi:MAG: VOC family protein [Bryobacteraceae bacterium]|jgi:catechol 2,3-dioxygenase-like lactoylglutathione lyase family enzyme